MSSSYFKQRFNFLNYLHLQPELASGKNIKIFFHDCSIYHWRYMPIPYFLKNAPCGRFLITSQYS